MEFKQGDTVRHKRTGATLVVSHVTYRNFYSDTFPNVGFYSGDFEIAPPATLQDHLRSVASIITERNPPPRPNVAGETVEHIFKTPHSMRDHHGVHRKPTADLKADPMRFNPKTGRLEISADMFAIDQRAPQYSIEVDNDGFVSGYDAMPSRQPINGISRADVDEFTLRCQRVTQPLPDFYQNIALKSAIYPGKDTPFGLMYVGLKMNGEAGEAAEHIGKAFRDDDLITIHPMNEFTGSFPINFNDLTPERRAAITKEIGDVLWYAAAMAKEIGKTLSQVMIENLDKLASRTERNKLSGSGDNR